MNPMYGAPQRPSYGPGPAYGYGAPPGGNPGDGRQQSFAVQNGPQEARMQYPGSQPGFSPPGQYPPAPANANPGKPMMGAPPPDNYNRLPGMGAGGSGPPPMAGSGAYQQGMGNAPPPQGNLGAPPQQGMPGPPNQRGMGGPPPGMSGGPPPQGMGGPPTAQGMGGPPSAQGMGGPPAPQGMVGPPRGMGNGPPPGMGGGGGGYQNGVASTPPPPQQQQQQQQSYQQPPMQPQSGAYPGSRPSDGNPDARSPVHAGGMPPQMINQFGGMSLGAKANQGPPSNASGFNQPPFSTQQQQQPHQQPQPQPDRQGSAPPGFPPPSTRPQQMPFPGSHPPQQQQQQQPQQQQPGYQQYGQPEFPPAPSAQSPPMVSPGQRPPPGMTRPGSAQAQPPMGAFPPAPQQQQQQQQQQGAPPPPMSTGFNQQSYQHQPPQQQQQHPQYPPQQQQHPQYPPQQFETMNGQHGGAGPGGFPPRPSSNQQLSMGPTPPPPFPPAAPGGMAPGPQYSGQPGMYPPPPGQPGPGVNQGYNQMHQPPGMGHGGMPPQPHHPPQQPPQQARRLDPEMMPSPIQVMEEDRRVKAGVFATNAKGLVPPLVTTDFVTQDQGNCNPRFMRSSMYTVPCAPEMMKQIAIPFTLTISPFAKLVPEEHAPPIVNLGESGPVRCIRCKAYMCPYMQFIDGGRRFQCSFCRATTEVPAEYFAHLDHTGLRVDKYERPELCLGSYEFVATKDYCKNNIFPLPPAFIFIIDVSYNNMKSGVVQLLCQNMKEILANLPRDAATPEAEVKVGFITYSSSVQFYNLKSCLAQPQVMVVPDVQDMFMPLLDGFLVSAQESESLIDSLMEQIPILYEDVRETETILGPAIKAGLEALKAADRSGKLFVFHSSLPIAEAPGKLKNRDDRKLLGTDKEKTVLAPQSQFYNQLGQECVAAACSVDLFTTPNAYIDIATIGQVSRLTGGQIFKYTYFQAELDGVRLIEDVKRSLNSQVAFDGILRVRTSTGIRPTDFFGNYFMSNTTDVELAAIDSDKAICVEIKHDDKLANEDVVCIQTAVLYTSVGGQRRLRLHNLSLNTCATMADLYRSCELDAMMNYFSKLCLRQLFDQPPKQVKDALTNKCAQTLACYRKNCASPSSAGQLILPECMKLLPLYVNCLLKNDAIAGGSDMTTDDRSYAMCVLSSMNVEASVAFIYPRLLSIHDLDPDFTTMPLPLRCTIDKIKDNGVYLLENGMYFFMWIGMNVDGEWLQNMFGVQSAAQIDIDKTNLMDLDNPVSQSVRRLIGQIRMERQRYLKLIVIRQRDRLEVIFKNFLVEDRTSDSSLSYVDFLCHVHKEIRNLLS